MKRLIVSISFFISLVISIQAQQIYNLDLDKSIEIAKEQSYSMLMLKQNLKVAEYNLKAATNSFRTNVDLNLVAPRYTQNIAEQIDTSGVIYYPQKELRYSGNLIVSQPLPTDGEISVRSELLNIDDYNNENKSLKFNTELRLSQPIESFYSYNRLRSELKRAELSYEMSFKRLKRAELDLVYTISQVYYGLLSAKERKVIAYQDLNRQQDAYETAQNKYTAGLIREVEALQMEIDLGAAQNSYDIASVDYEMQVNNFKQKIGISLQDSVSIESEFEYSEVLVDVEHAVERGLENRLEIREHEIGIELSDIEIKRQKSHGLVNGEISAYYNFTGVDNQTIGTPFNDMFTSTWSDINNRPGNRGIELRVNIPIIDWGVNRSLVKAAIAEQQREKYALDLEKVVIESDIRNSVNQLHSSLRRLKLLEKNVSIAERNFDISRARFNNGDIDAQTLALDRQRLNNAYITRLQAYISYKLLLADLSRKTFYDYESNVPYSYEVEL